MPNYRVEYQMAFKDQEWKNIYQAVGASAQAVHAVVRTTEMLSAIGGLHGNGVEVKAVGVYNWNGLGVDVFHEYEHWTNTRGAEYNADVTNNSAIFTMRTDLGDHTNHTYSGLPDAFIARDVAGNAAPGAGFNQAWWALRTQIIAAGLGITRQDPPGEAGPTAWRGVRLMEPDSIVIGGDPVTEDSFTKFTVVGAGDHGLQVGDEILFSRGEIDEGTQGLGSPFIIADRTATTFLLNTRYWPREDHWVPKRLRVRKVTYDVAAISGMSFDDFGTRQRGQGGGPRGRTKGRSFRH